MIRGIISDLDGTLLDSMEARLDAWIGAFTRFGVEVPRNDLKPLIGLPGVDLAGKYYEYPRKIEEAEESIFGEKLPQIELFPDVFPTFNILLEKGMKIVIVTSGRREAVSRIKLPVNDIVTIDDVKVGKPHTEPYEKALKIMGLKPSEVLVVGDSENDMIPARTLGSVSVLVRHGNHNVSDHADYMIDEIGELPKLIEHINGRSPVQL
ncbi:MAG: HAD family hydrolase [Thermoplasmata archaeon]